MKIYVASSWRNPWQPATVLFLRARGHEVYDFREPEPGVRGFAWSDIDPKWQAWKPSAYRDALKHDVAELGYHRDISALVGADACLLVLPCGNSAHLELGIAVGAHKRTAVLFPHGLPLSHIGGHAVGGGPCAPCGDLDGCWLPGKLHKIEPELMTKAADEILIGVDELEAWSRR